MPRITLKETITKEIEIPMDTLCELIDHLSEKWTWCRVYTIDRPQ